VEALVTVNAPGCRGCGTALVQTFADLGMSPLSNAYRGADELRSAETFWPLHAWVCGACYLVQLEAFESPLRIFANYAYFSSYADTWIAHSRRYAADAVARYGLGPDSLVMEAASNDGYLLREFVERSIPVLGIEPAANVAAVARERGVRTDVAFFGVATARRLVASGMRADLFVANNVLAHVPDIHDFVGGIAIVLKPGATATIEFPHVARLIENVEFDTIYHEHFSYLSIVAIEPIVARHGLRLHAVQELPTHGGSLRVSLVHADERRPPEGSVQAMRTFERDRGLDQLSTYEAFQLAMQACKRETLRFLIDAAASGKRVAGYGAPAKGSTFLNYCGVRSDLLAFTVDRSTAKQGRFMPGVHVPIFEPGRLLVEKPDYVMILPWNLSAEIVDQMRDIRAWGGRFVVAVPTIRILES
jgi:SAM-dependent methyltransferase